MKSLVNFVAVAMFVFSAVEVYSHSALELQVEASESSKFIANTCPIYPTCKQESESKSMYRVEPRTNTHDEKPLIANTCPIYPTCKQEFESELA